MKQSLEEQVGNFIEGDFITPKSGISSVGEEFVSWAEKYWAIKEKYEGNVVEGEASNFEIVKPYFISKINELIKDNLKYSGLI